MKNSKAKRDIYQEITDRIIEGLEKGSAPWLKPWKNSNTGADVSMPHNAATGRAYSGINVMILWAEGDIYGSNGWLTYKQAKDIGGQVRKGEKGTLVTFFKPYKIAENKGQTNEKDKTIPLIKGFTVFNVEQCDFPEGTKLHQNKDIPAFEQTAIMEICEVVKAEVVLGGNRACYIPSRDLVQMPHLDQFEDQTAFDATLAHELTHWTSNKKRCDRKLGIRFGDDAYAMEELIAEIGSAFLCAQMGIQNNFLRHESYIANWLEVLKADKKAIFSASSMARQSNEWLTKKALENIAA